jgi:hypothetical protein
VYCGLHILFQDVKAITQDKDILDVIEEIRLSCNEAVHILDGLLFFNEIDEGNVKLSVERVDARCYLPTILDPFLQEVPPICLLYPHITLESIL